MPLYKTIKLSDLLNDPEKHLKPNMHVRVQLDVEISFEESTFIKETFVDTYKLRELAMIPMREEIGVDEGEAEVAVLSVDQIVTDQIGKIESEAYDKSMLINIYNNL